MNRREILTAGMATAAMTATAVLGKGAEKLQPIREPLEGKMKALEERFDKLEHHHKNLIRAGGLAFALSTGIDVLVLF